MLQMKKCDISIIIPIYEVEDYIQECLESVIEQKDIDNITIECLLIDDCGSDNSMDIATSLIESYNGSIKFKIIKHEYNKGLSAARNTGIHNALGKYLFFIDSDDYISDTCIYDLFQYANQYPNVELIIGNAVFLYGDKTTKPFIETKLIKCKYSFDKRRTRKYYFSLPVSAWNKLINRSWLMSNNLYFKSGIIFEDNEWTNRAFFALSSFIRVTDIQPSYYYRQRPNSIMSSLKSSEEQEEKYNKVIVESFLEAEFWDKYYTLRMVSYLFGLKRFAHSEIYNTILLSQLTRLAEAPQSKKTHRVIFRYLRLGRPWCRIKVANAICSFIK